MRSSAPPLRKRSTASLPVVRPHRNRTTNSESRRTRCPRSLSCHGRSGPIGARSSPRRRRPRSLFRRRSDVHYPRFDVNEDSFGQDASGRWWLSRSSTSRAALSCCRQHSPACLVRTRGCTPLSGGMTRGSGRVKTTGRGEDAGATRAAPTPPCWWASASIRSISWAVPAGWAVRGRSRAIGGPTVGGRTQVGCTHSASAACLVDAVGPAVDSANPDTLGIGPPHRVIGPGEEGGAPPLMTPAAVSDRKVAACDTWV